MGLDVSASPLILPVAFRFFSGRRARPSERPPVIPDKVSGSEPQIRNPAHQGERKRMLHRHHIANPMKLLLGALRG